MFKHYHMAETNFYYSTQHDVIFAFWVTYKCISLMEEVSYVLGDSYKHFIFNRTFGSKTGTTNGGKACRRLQWMSAHQTRPCRRQWTRSCSCPQCSSLCSHSCSGPQCSCPCSQTAQNILSFMQRPTMQLLMQFTPAIYQSFTIL